eukprot:TRINITY_DN9363_c0_g1_i2.p1 TRINITY_DN9363_c0_g1~~TRINITY_DN9363_c0_g1_i2.p1  ORF type:complete len:1249 (+),score=264.19 TRINITY_DN9363_c0_g1_i2:49-3795(+)
MQHAKRSLSSQRRGYLNLYPKPESGTSNPPVFSQLYYKLPDYAVHRDHKQVRDPKLDKTNTNELTRDEERRQRIQIMAWRQEMAENGEAEPRPVWEHKNDEDKSAFRDHWSGAQLIEYNLRTGRSPKNLPSVESEKAKIDPHGILSSSNPLDVAWSSLPHYKPNQLSFRVIPPNELQQLSSRYQRLTGAKFPVNGLDFPEIVEKLSSLNSTTALSDADNFLADLSEATSTGYGCDELLLQLKANTRFESKYEWFTSENNHRFQADEVLSDEGLPRLSSAYSQNGPKGFWETFIRENEIDSDFKAHMEFFINLPAADVVDVLQKVERLYTDYGVVMERRYNRLVKADTIDPTNPIQKAELILAGVQDWAQNGDASGEKKDDDDEWELERLDLQSILDTNISPNDQTVPLSEWLRWHFLDQFIVPRKLELFDPTHLLAARFQNLSFSATLKSLISDHISHIRTLHPLLFTSERQTVPFYQFLRCVKNCSNVPNYNLNMSPAYFNSQKTLQRYIETNTFSKEIVDAGDEDVVDLSSQIAEMFVQSPNKDWSNANTASAAREQVRKDCSSWSLVRQLKQKEKSFEVRKSALEAVKSTVFDVENCIGVLRRKAASDIQSELSGEEENFSIKNVTLNTEEATPETGKQYNVTWEWTPSADYGIQKPTLEQKQKAYAGFVANQSETANRIANDEALVDDVFNYIQTIDGADEIDRERYDSRREWAVTKTYHNHLRSKALKEIEQSHEIEQKYPVHVVLLKKTSDSLLEAISNAREKIASIAKSENSEDARLSVMLQNIASYVVNSHLEDINHMVGSDEVTTRLAEGVAEGTLDGMLKSLDAVSDLVTNSSNGSSWDAVTVLASSVPNTGSVDVIMPQVSSSSGDYKISVYNKDFTKVGETVTFKVDNKINQYLDEYISSQRSGRPPLSELDGKRVLLIPEEIPNIITFLKTKGIQFTLESECSLGSDVISIPTDASSGAMPFVHIDVLKYQLEHLHTPSSSCPIEAFTVRNEPLLRHFWNKQTPGGSELEWIKAKAEVAKRMEENCYSWLAYDGDLEHMPVEERGEYLDSKIANLTTTGGTSLATATYEGSGYLTALEIDEDVKKMRVPVDSSSISDVSSPLEFTDRSNGQLVTITKSNTFLILTIQGNQEAINTVRFNERRWGLEVGEVVCSSLSPLRSLFNNSKPTLPLQNRLSPSQWAKQVFNYWLGSRRVANSVRLNVTFRLKYRFSCITWLEYAQMPSTVHIQTTAPCRK